MFYNKYENFINVLKNMLEEIAFIFKTINYSKVVITIINELNANITL